MKNNTAPANKTVSSNRFDSPFFKDSTKAANLFTSVYGFKPSRLLSNEDGRITSILPYADWDKHPNARLFFRDPDAGNLTINDRATYLLGVFGVNENNNFGEVSPWQDEIVDSFRMEDYKDDKNLYKMHPSGIHWFFNGLSRVDREDNVVDDGVPVSLPISVPGSRVRLYDIFNKTRRFPTMSHVRLFKNGRDKPATYLIPGCTDFITGVFQPWPGFIVGDGIFEGTVQTVGNKIRRERL